MDEAELVRRATEGDRAAMGRLYEAHAPHVFAVVRRLMGDDHAAEDVSQEVWIRAFTRIDQFRGDAGFGTWIHRVARNAALSRLRRTNRRAEVEDDAAGNGEDLGGRADDAVINRRMLEEAIDELPPGYRRVLVLHDVEGHTHEEIAKMLEVAVGTSKSQLHKARCRMRELLAPAGANDDVGEVGRDG